MTQTYLEVHNLCKTFTAKNGSVEALKGVSLSIGKGEIFGVIGLSGAGKSTLVRCMNLLERPDSGDVLLNGESLLKLSKEQLRLRRQKIGMIFQHFNLLEQQTVLENVCFPLEIRGIPRKERRGWRTRQTPTPPSFPAGRSSGWPLPGCLPTSRRSYYATRPPAPLTRRQHKPF